MDAKEKSRIRPILERATVFLEGSNAHNRSQFMSGREDRKRLYAQFQESFDPHPDVVFLESMSGAKVMDSPFALYRELRRRACQEGRDVLFVWSANSRQAVPIEVLSDPMVEIVKRHSIGYIYFLARAGLVVCNSVLPEYFVRAPGQVYLNTWHGIGFKLLGRTAKSPLGPNLSSRNMMQATHILSPCEFMTDVMKDGFGANVAGDALIGEFGYPRIDLTINADEQVQSKVRNSLHVDSSLPTVLYAPTWRDSSDGSPFDSVRLEKDLQGLSRLPINVVFLGHHLMMKDVDEGKLRNLNILIPPESINTNILLSVVDVVVTDYSSIFFDVLSMEKPVVHYVYDFDEYVRDRGLALALSELPGTIARTSEELFEAVRASVEDDWSPDSVYLAAKDRFSPHDDGEASSRAVDWLTGVDSKYSDLVERPDRLKTVFWGGRLDDSTDTDDFFDDVRSAVQRGESDVTVVLARSVAKLDRVMKSLDSLGNHISVITRDSYEMGMTDAEQRVRDRAERSRDDGSSQLYDFTYKREYRRLFGSAKFDEVVCFCKLSKFWRELSVCSYR